MTTPNIINLAVTILVFFGIIWLASKAWKAGQA